MTCYYCENLIHDIGWFYPWTLIFNGSYKHMSFTLVAHFPNMITLIFGKQDLASRLSKERIKSVWSFNPSNAGLDANSGALAPGQ